MPRARRFRRAFAAPAVHHSRHRPGLRRNEGETTVPTAAGIVGIGVAEGGNLEAEALQRVYGAEIAGQVGEVGACSQ